MAGKFLTLEEVARLLGVSVEEVNRLVDRKKLFPMRDGAGVKFKADDVERLASSLGDESSQDDGLSLDLDGAGLSGTGGSAAADDELAIGDAVDDADWVLGGASGVESASQTIVREGDKPPAAAAAASAISLDGGRDDSVGDDLALESLVGASSPSLPRSGLDGSKPDDGSLKIDLSAVTGGGSGPQPGSRATGSLLGGAPSGAGAALSGPLDSGLSLEDVELAVSGIRSAGGSIAGSAASSGVSLAGEAFELGGDMGDEESASVVIATEESGDSSFFGAALDDSASVSFDDPSSSRDGSSVLAGALPDYAEYAVDTTFSVWQILGLASCSLLLLTAAFVMLDLVWTIRAPRETALTAPLLEALAKTFSW